MIDDGAFYFRVTGAARLEICGDDDGAVICVQRRVDGEWGDDEMVSIPTEILGNVIKALQKIQETK